jgi:murein DD-endopeptidase MepM/ murein hydrolase activator NlpD
MRRPGSALVVSTLLALAFAGGASAIPDGPLEPYFEHLDQLVLEWPADGSVNSDFGPRGGRMHLGIDVGSLRSLEVTAATSGSVTAVGWPPGYAGYGHIVLVDVGDGYSVLYAHLSRAGVQVGDWVVSGQKLGLAGCSGSCTGTHLHFELRRRGRPVDPRPWLAESGYNRSSWGG